MTPSLSVSSWSLHRLLGSAPIYGADTAPPNALSAADTLLTLPAKMAAAGFTAYELCHVHLPTTDPAYLKALRAAQESAGIALHCLLIDGGDLTHAEHAVSLNPNDAKILDTLGAVLTYVGEQERALEWFARSEKLDPYAPDDQRLDFLCDCYYLLHRYEKVIEIHRDYQQVPAVLYLILAAAYAQSGMLDEAKASVLKYQNNRPAEHDAATMIKYQVRMCARLEDRDHWLEGYRKAGIDI